MFWCLFSSPDGLLYFAPERPKHAPKITPFAKDSKAKIMQVAGKANPYYFKKNVLLLILCCKIHM